jgi:hypothetical protein
MKMRQLIIDRATTLVVAAGLALSVSGVAASQVARRAPVTTETRVRAAKAPYTAEYKITRVQALADGTTITQETTEVKALDSQGRRMTATTTTGHGTPTTHVMVYDPVARAQTFWTSPGKVAHVLQMSPAGENHCMTITRDDVRVSSGPHAQYASEDIGTETIQGIEARGRRRTTTIPEGAAGNDAPLVTTSEMWTALTVGLDGLLVREITDDPRQGKSTRELTNLSQGDPDPATFQPPEGYEIQTKESAGCQDGPPAEVSGGRNTTK